MPTLASRSPQPVNRRNLFVILDLLYDVAAGNPWADVITSPEGGKLSIKPERARILPRPTDYFDDGD